MPKTVFAVVTFEFEDAPSIEAAKAVLEDLLSDARETVNDCVEMKVAINEIDEINN